MTANSSRCSFHIKKQAITNMKYFVYQDKKYGVDFDLLKKNSIYFYENQEKYKGKQEIELIGEHEKCIKLTDESIKAFISSCQNEPCSIENSSIIQLQYLAHKFKFNELIQFTDKFIEENSENLIFETLFFKIDEMKGKNDNNSFFDTSKEEHIISNQLPKYIQKEKMLNLPIEILYRIFALFYNNQQNKEEIKSDMTTFLFKCLDKYGKKASALFSFIDFGEQRIEVVNRLLENYSKKFDFNLINKTLTETVKDLTSEVTKQKEEYSILFKQMQETFKEQLAELKEMKKQEEDKQKQSEIDNKKRIEKFSSDVEKIKNDFEKNIKSTQDQFNQICKKQDEFIDNFIVRKYHQIILDTITYGQFRKFDDKLKDHFLAELFKNENKQINQEFIDSVKLILYFFVPESYDSIQMIQIFKGNEKDQPKIKITNKKVEDLYQKGQLNSCLTSCINLFNDILVEIEYPCNKFEQIMKIISDIQLQNEQKMKISFTINDKSFFEQKNEWKKIINICKVGKSIDEIPEKALENCSSLTQFTIPSSVTSIGNCAFSGCSSLEEVKIPTTVKLVGDNCFDDCQKLNQITINPFYTKIQFNTFISFNKSIKYSAAKDSKLKTNEHILIPYNMLDNLYQTNFLDSSELTSYINECSEIIFEIQYPSSNYSNIYQKIINLKQNNSAKVKIGIFYTQMEVTNDFYNNKDINYVKLDSNIKKTPDESRNGSFENCSSLIGVFLPPSLNKIGDRTFKRCSSLSLISIPSSVTLIGEYAFDGCSSLTQISIPSSVTSIGEYSFSGCSSLTQISIPSSVTSIGDSAFLSCSSLTQISIPSSVSSIESAAFQNCSSLTQISIPSSVTSIGKYAFNNCSSLTQISIPSSVTSIGDSAFLRCSSLTQISIPSSVTSIGGGAFSVCSSLTQISIPSSVTEIGDGFLAQCPQINKVEIVQCEKKLIEYFDNKFIAFKTNQSSEIYDKMIWVKPTINAISIPSSVTSIGGSAFSGCSSLKQISIPSSVTSIGGSAFSGCSSLAQISIPSSVTSIGNCAFHGCSSLTQISIPSRIDSNNLGINSNVKINRI